MGASPGRGGPRGTLWRALSPRGAEGGGGARDAGRIVVDGRVFFDAATGVSLPPQARRVGYVFQGYALFPHLSVAENVAFGLRGRPRAERARRAAEGLERP